MGQTVLYARPQHVFDCVIDLMKSTYPDNYTDPPTFLSHLQRNPRLQPYDFWPLAADSTVIVQHICSVALFICCFVGIFQERISPVSVVSWGTAGTVLGWVLWDFWVSQEEALNRIHEAPPAVEGYAGDAETTASGGTSSPSTQKPGAQGVGLGLSLASANLQPRQGHSQSTTSAPSVSSSTLSSPPNGLSNPIHHTMFPQYHSTSFFSHRNQQRLATAKSAILIYCALLGLSPILKSLTKSTSSDSIWALSCWLMCINVFFFDYGGGVGVKFVRSALNADSHPPYAANPTLAYYRNHVLTNLYRFPASLSTNAALMASTVLASRLPSTTHVFSLTLFSIEVFGLFPVFRRHLRHISWRGHLLLTLSLVIGAGAGMGVTLVRDGGWKAAVVGVVLCGLGTMVGMGGCSWWLIGLQKYKNVVIGPWDPARPVIRGGQWE